MSAIRWLGRVLLWLFWSAIFATVAGAVVLVIICGVTYWLDGRPWMSFLCAAGAAFIVVDGLVSLWRTRPVRGAG